MSQRARSSQMLSKDIFTDQTHWKKSLISQNLSEKIAHQHKLRQMLDNVWWWEAIKNKKHKRA